MLAVIPFFLLASFAKAAPCSVTPSSAPIYSNCNHDFASTWSGGPTNYATVSLISAFVAQYPTIYTTSFINGQSAANCIYDASVVSTLQSVYSKGHQLASSGWSNADLTTLTYDEIDVEIGRLNDAFSKILGVTPNFYRPPSLTAINDDVAQYLQQKFGMTVVTWSDNSNDLTATSGTSLRAWYEALDTSAPHMTLGHQSGPSAIQNLILDGGFWLTLKAHYSMITVASCLDMIPYTTTTGQTGTRDTTWTCSGTWTPPTSTATETCTAATTTTTTDSTPSATPSTLASYNGWDSVGCFVDAVDARVLPELMGTTGGAAAMTAEICLDACHAAGYKYAGIEWSQECYCGNTQPTEEATDGRCDMVCNGNPLEYCGGGNGISIYQYTDANNEPATTQTYNDWAYSDCYVDSVASRALPVPMAVAGAMTVELCLDACHAAGYSIAGIEWSQECYCGYDLPAQVAAEGSCDMPCQGNPLEICGGGLGLTTYEYSGDSGPSVLQTYNSYNSVGCFVDSVDNRALPVQMAVTDGSIMTVEVCVDACNAAGYDIAGVEYGEECYCGRSLPTVAALDGRCDMTCKGNALEYCGGGNGINVYQSTSNSPSVLQSYNGWSSSGCYVDSVAARSLPYAVTTINDSDMTAELCLDACSSLGYTYAGLEYAQECYCGAELTAQQATDGRCNMVCNGNSLEFCGGGNGLNVYTKAA